MAGSGYLTLKGQKQGAINGSVTIKGRENTIQVHAFTVEIDSPRDPVSGLAAGKRIHKPVVILKEIDKSSPLLWNALVNNENLVTWDLKFWAANPTGVQKQTYTIDLTNASVASIREYMVDNLDASAVNTSMLEEITFTYQKIQWTWADGGITASDDWGSPVA